MRRYNRPGALCVGGGALRKRQRRGAGWSRASVRCERGVDGRQLVHGGAAEGAPPARARRGRREESTGNSGCSHARERRVDELRGVCCCGLGVVEALDDVLQLRAALLDAL